MYKCPCGYKTYAEFDMNLHIKRCPSAQVYLRQNPIAIHQTSEGFGSSVNFGGCDFVGFAEDVSHQEVSSQNESVDTEYSGGGGSFDGGGSSSSYDSSSSCDSSSSSDSGSSSGDY